MAPTGPSVPASVGSMQPSDAEIRDKTREVFGVTPCLWQIKACKAQLSGKHVISISPTGSGKTLSFLMPFIWKPKGITLLIAPLQLLGEQHAGEPVLEALGVESVNITVENASDDLFKEIGEGKFRLINLAPEYVAEDPRFSELWKRRGFARLVNRLIFDEAHCVSEWGDFRQAYFNLRHLRYIFTEASTFTTSATLPDNVISDVKRQLQLPETVEVHFRSNDRPNVALGVRKMRYSLKSMQDLAFLLPTPISADNPPDTFLCYMLSKRACEAAAEFMWSRMPMELRSKIVWMHSDMSKDYLRACIVDLRNKKLWGVFCTDIVGMGIHLPDVPRVVVYQPPATLSSLMQRFGRSARNPTVQGYGILLVEPKYFDEDIEKRRIAAEKRTAKKAEAKKQVEKQVDEASGNTNKVLTKAVDAGPSPEKGKKRIGVDDQLSPPLTPPKKRRLSESVENRNAFSVSPSPTPCEETLVPDSYDDTQAPEWGDGSDWGDEAETTQPDAAAMSHTAQHGDSGDSSVAESSSVVVAPSEQSKSKRQRKERAVEDAVRLFINSETRNVNCRRSVIHRYFGNGREKYVFCCNFCSPKKPTICCDICHPQSFLFLAIKEAALSEPRAPSKLKVPSTYSMAAREHELSQSIVNWAEKETTVLWGPHALFGRLGLISDDTIQRIVALASAGVLFDVANLEREVDWYYVKTYGGKILELVKQTHPDQTKGAPTSTAVDAHPTPLELSPSEDIPRSQSRSPSPSPHSTMTPGQKLPRSKLSPGRSRGPYRCRSCGDLGHNAANWRCPNSVKNPINQKSDENKENKPIAEVSPAAAATVLAPRPAEPVTPKPAPPLPVPRAALGRLPLSFMPVISSPLSRSSAPVEAPSGSLPPSGIKQPTGTPSTPFTPNTMHNPYLPRQSSFSGLLYSSMLSNPYLPRSTAHSSSHTHNQSPHLQRDNMTPPITPNIPYTAAHFTPTLPPNPSTPSAAPFPPLRLPPSAPPSPSPSPR